MIALATRSGRLIDRLPPVRGRLTEKAPLAAVTWFRVGGPAEVMFKPADVEDLAQFIANKPADVPVTVIGVGSNLLVRDGGVPGVVIRLGRGFTEVAHEIDDAGARLRAGAGVLDLNVALHARDAGIAGLEFLSGIPGTIGGAVRMNAGAYGREMVDVILGAEAIDPHGVRHWLTAGELGLSYRHCDVPEDWIFTAAVLAGQPGERDSIQKRISEIQEARESSQPIRTRTGGSTFANPAEPAAEGRKAWQLVDLAGCRGLVRGGAQVSEKHCNFLINTGSATAADIEDLGDDVRARVAARFGVTLRWEIKRIGLRSDSESDSGT
ncbi:MAG: UDP-N-acetylmuramate dehydrogenase [Alphaproteobacteria bacterium]|nr:UDP-N-acetylmuramate dehydrogenase [Alphaproteobacteria bacterium]